MQSLSIDGFELSPQQKRLWQLQSAQTGQPYRVQAAVNLQGPLHKAALKLALQKIVDRHEILRTHFQGFREMEFPLQAIATTAHPAIAEHDLSHLPEPAQERELQARLQAARQTPLELETGSALAVDLIALASTRHVLVLQLPALCGDGFSLFYLLDELLQIYAAHLDEGGFDEGEPLQYADLAAWQNELFASPEGEAGMQYWRDRADSPRLAQTLPQAQPLTPDAPDAFFPQTLALTLPPHTAQQLQALAERYQTSAEVVLLHAWQVFLGRMTQETEILVGTCRDGRNYEELVGAVGPLAKYLPIQGTYQPQAAFSAGFKPLAAALAAADKWQESFSWETSSDRELACFPFCFDFLSLPRSYGAAGLSASVDEHYTCYERYEVKLSAWLQPDTLTATFHYDAHRFDRETIDSLAAQFTTFFVDALHHPETAIAQLSLLTKRDRQRLLVDFNRTQREFSSYPCVHHWLSAQAQRYPQRTAVVFEGEQLTYRELDERSDRLAHYLQTWGVQPETIVAFCVERSLDLIVGIWGILKAGAAYLPLEPTLPTEALTFRIQAARSSLVLTQSHLSDRLANPGTPVVCIDTETVRSFPPPSQPLAEQTTSANLAYVIYTSGSTGQPKGVAIEHRQLLNYINSILDRFAFPDGLSFASVSTFAADLGNTAIFAAFCTGGCLHLIARDRAVDPVALGEYCQQQGGIDCLKIVPSHLKALLSGTGGESILPRKYLILGGEAAPWELIDQVRRTVPTCQIFNHYGPTEATVGVLTYAVTTQESPASGIVPLGRPLANTRVYVLDGEQQLVPIGVPGELYIGGDNLARGYLHRPDLTRERFIPSPFEADGARLYKTGDLVRYRPDGTLEFLGRLDNQIQLHGFRIELEAIEAVIKQHPQVREAVVVLGERESGHKQLIGYFVAEKQPLSPDLGEFLARQLPDYSCPSVLVPLTQLPLNPNGKVDRQALPRPETASERDRFVAPRTREERLLAEIWSQVLGRDEISVNDNFFTLGGDSILSIQVIAKANQAQLKLTPKQLFENQTIAQLAAVAGTSATHHAEQGIVTGELPLTPIQHWFFAQNLPEPHHWNQSLLLTVDCALTLAQWREIVQRLLAHHDALRLCFQRQAGAWQACCAPVSEEIPLTPVDLRGLAASEQTAAIERIADRTQKTIDLAQGPLMQVVWFQLAPEGCDRLLIIVHHLAIDGVSWRILLSDLHSAIEQLRQGKAIEFPPKTVSYQQWAQFCHQYARSDSLAKERDYWLAQGARSLPPLPVDFPEGNNTLDSVATLSVSLTAAETQALLQEVPSAYQTQVNDVLLTALVQAFAAETGCNSLLVDLEGHGREPLVGDLDVSRSVGWFTILFPVRLEIAESSTPGEALKAVKEQLRAVPNHGIGYGLLRYLKPDRQLQSLPSAPVRFNYLGQFDPALQAASHLAIAPEASGCSRTQNGDRVYLLDINGWVRQGQLHLQWSYSRALHRTATVSQLAQNWLSAVRALIAHCQSPVAGGYTPSDFPAAKLQQNDLDKLMKKISSQQ